MKGRYIYVFNSEDAGILSAAGFRRANPTGEGCCYIFMKEDATNITKDEIPVGIGMSCVMDVLIF